ncbi:hypothetical protein A8W25_22270 [Streptomyces sp. ERV7]|uniref:hypothetical protein n=1 Tax=Streptomyces sp. ERV7 TaxID=1322334 RepID=UPI0007F4FC27|nr:hypothetical protein [Streptomyces sp. ERV7]OAR22382.1 hypothetical protein A8W25_22270 [Streptomyces sp. ERV7]
MTAGAQRAPSRTRTARQQRDAKRDARRESLFVLLARAQRGAPLTPAEAGLLRTHVEAELAEGDQARRSAAGQSAAVRREQQRTRAAEAAIVEAEEHAQERAEQQLAKRVQEAEQRAAEHEAAALRYANYLAAAQRECGAPNWPALPDTIKALAAERDRALARLSK